MTFSVKAKAKAPVENGIGAGRVLLIMAGAIAAVAGMAALAWFSGDHDAEQVLGKDGCENGICYRRGCTCGDHRHGKMRP